MKTLPLLALATCLGALALAGAACGEDTALVRPRLDGGGGDVETPDAAGGDSGALACGAAVPTTYESAAFAQNAAVELALAQRFVELGDKMRSAEGASGVTDVTANDLKAIYSAGAPSLRAVSTTEAQALVDGYFADFEAAMGKAWTPDDADQDGGAASGGKYGDYVFDAVGIDLRAATENTLLGGALYNHVLGVVASPITEATVDKLVAAFGASAAFANSTDPDAGADADRLIAAHASRLDATASAPGPYAKIRSSLLRMKAAAKAGESCKADLDEAVATFLLEWERTTYASAISSLSAAVSSAANPTAGATTLHAFGEAVGFVQSFKGLGRRKITDAQIDALLVKTGAGTAYKLVTSPGDRSLKLNESINDIQLYESFTPAEVEGFKKPR